MKRQQELLTVITNNHVLFTCGLSILILPNKKIMLD